MVLLLYGAISFFILGMISGSLAREARFRYRRWISQGIEEVNK